MFLPFTICPPHSGILNLNSYLNTIFKHKEVLLRLRLKFYCLRLIACCSSVSTDNSLLKDLFRSSISSLLSNPDSLKQLFENSLSLKESFDSFTFKSLLFFPFEITDFFF
jgi:hypothetical protein